MRLLIVSGRSGSGKTVSLNALEDLGYYCVDNLPVDMLPALVEKFNLHHQRLAVSIDARNLPIEVSLLKEVIHKLKKSQLGYQTDILYLDAQDSDLLQRFSETRRKHPLTNQETSLQEAVSKEKILLSPLSNIADITIDTTYLSKHQLASLIRERIANGHANTLQLLIQSFGFKNGVPTDADFIFDVRCLPNPYWQPHLRKLTGLDPKIAEYLDTQPEVKIMIDDITSFLHNWIPHFEKDNRSYLTVGIGCTGGQHRSVFITDALVKMARLSRYNVQVRHRDLAGII